MFQKGGIYSVYLRPSVKMSSESEDIFTVPNRGPSFFGVPSYEKYNIMSIVPDNTSKKNNILGLISGIHQ